MESTGRITPDLRWLTNRSYNHCQTCISPQPTPSLMRPTRCPAMSGRSTDTDRFATAMLDASGLQRSAARRRRLQTHSSELFDFFGDLIARPRLLICGLGVRFPPGSPASALISRGGCPAVAVADYTARPHLHTFLSTLIRRPVAASEFSTGRGRNRLRATSAHHELRP